MENSFVLPRKVLHTNGFRLSVHFYIILPATLINLLYAPLLRHVTSCCINRFQAGSPIDMPC